MLRVARGFGFALIGAVVLGAVACGDDDSVSDGGADTETDGGSGTGGSSGMMKPRAGASGATAGMGGTGGAPAGAGDRVEGAPCTTVADCESGLACVASGDSTV